MAHPMVRAFVQITSAALLVVILLVAYVAYAEHSAERKAKAFCSTVSLGENANALLDRAKSSGADERRTRWIRVSDNERSLPVTFTGFTPISRHICFVTAAETVTSAEYAYLD